MSKDNGRMPGSVRVEHDRSMEQVRTITQLDQECVYFLSVFADETTGKVKKYSLDVEWASDSHYMFEEKQKKMIRQKAEKALRLKWRLKKLDFSEVLIAYVKLYGGARLQHLISEYATAVFHYD